jgi:hypothetical protein
MIITVNNASFAGLGLGTTGNWVDDWCDLVGVSDLTQRNGFKALYNGMLSNNIWGRPNQYIMPYAGSTAASQKYLFENSATPRTLTFGGTPLFSAAGFDPNNAGNASVPFTPPAGDFINFSAGVFTSEGESAPAQSNTRRLLLDYQGENTGDGTATAKFTLARRFEGANDNTAALIGVGASGYLTINGAITTKAGFLQMVRVSNVLTLIDDGVQVVENANYNTTVAKGGGSRTPKLGSDNQGIQFSTANQKFAYLSTLTKSEAIIFDGLVKNLMTALGR